MDPQAGSGHTVFPRALTPAENIRTEKVSSIALKLTQKSEPKGLVADWKLLRLKDYKSAGYTDAEYADSVARFRQRRTIMAKKMINIRLEESVWRQAKYDAVLKGTTLQNWLTQVILRAVAKKK